MIELDSMWSEDDMNSTEFDEIIRKKDLVMKKKQPNYTRSKVKPILTLLSILTTVFFGILHWYRHRLMTIDERMSIDIDKFEYSMHLHGIFDDERTYKVPEIQHITYITYVEKIVDFVSNIASTVCTSIWGYASGFLE